MLDEKYYMENVWELYGLKENPFATSPILVKGGTLPLDCFVGREEHVKRLSRILASKGGSRTLVYGDTGVGKTSFVNFVRAQANQRGVFTPFKEIAVLSEWGPNDVVLNTLAAIYATLKLLTKRPISFGMFEKLETLVDATKAINLEVTIGGTGGGYNKEIKPPTKLTSFALQQFFAEVIAELAERTKKEIIIHYNNLELIEEENLQEIFDDLRDFFQTPKAHFVLVGNLTTHSLIQNMPRVASILSDAPIRIEPFTFNEISNIISKRFEALKINDKMQFIIPYTDDCLRALFNLYGGNIRNILNSLSTAVFEATVEKPVVLDKGQLAVILKMVAEKKYLSNLTPRERSLLSSALKKDEITNKQLSEDTCIARSNVSTYVNDLVKMGCMYLRRKEGKDKYWSVDSRLKWLLLD